MVANDAYMALAWSIGRMSMRLKRRKAPTRSIRGRVAGDLGPAAVEVDVGDLPLARPVGHLPPPPRADVELAQHAHEVEREAAVAADAAPRHVLAEQAYRGVEVLDRLRQVALVGQ